MNRYEWKQEQRRQRLEARAERLRGEGAARFESGMSRLRAIPFGQPILVGHHSERRDRNYRRKAVAAVDKGIALQKQAGELEARAAAVGTGGISSDDPDAIAKLRVELEQCEQRQALMIAANKVVRAFWNHGNRADNTDAELGRYFEKMAAAGIKSPAVARKLLEPDCCGRRGFADYETKNNGANIRRIKVRIAELERNAAREHKEEELAGGVRLVENVEDNRLQLIFPGKPSLAARGILKRSGFRWAPSAGAWQRHLNNGARWAAKSALEQIQQREGM